MSYVEPVYIVLKKKHHLDELIKDFADHSEFAFDIETNGLDPRADGARINSIAFAFDRTTWVIPLATADSRFVTHASRYQLFRLLSMATNGKNAIAHNGKFDNSWIGSLYGASFYLQFDTMLASHTLDENQSHDLESVAQRELGAPIYDIPLSEKKNPTDLAKFYRYQAFDAAYTLAIKKIYAQRLQRSRSLRRLFYRLVMPVARAFEIIDAEGFYLDQVRYEENAKTCKAEVDRLELELNGLTKTKVNWNSPQQVSKFLFEELKLKPTVFTSKGKPSTGEEALYNIADAHPVAKKLVEYREASKFYGTYFEGWREATHNGRVYFSTKIHGTVTGRFSSRLHQTPRDNRIRSCVTAPPGWVFWQADLSQAELRMVAIAARETEMLTCFRSGIDIHWRTLLSTIATDPSGTYIQPALETASKIAGKSIRDVIDACDILLKAGHEKAISIWPKWKEGRKKAKGINFGFVYGMKEYKFIEYAKLKYGFEPTEYEATQLRQAYFDLYIGLAPWHEKQKRLAHLDGQVTNLFGRIRRLPTIHSKDSWPRRREAERQAINSPIQGVIGDWKAAGVIALHEQLPRNDVKICGEHHDAVLGIMRESTIDTNVPLIAKLMRRPPLLAEFGLDDLPIEIEVEVELGPWGSGKKYELEKTNVHG